MKKIKKCLKKIGKAYVNSVINYYQFDCKINPIL